MQEELKANINIQSLGFTVENFFNYSNSIYHEIGFYYFAEFTGSALHLNTVDEFVGVEEKMEGHSKFHLLFKWVPFNEVGNYNLKPGFLKDKLLTLKQTTSHVIHRDLNQIP